jgi:hypothetical protein
MKMTMKAINIAKTHHILNIDKEMSGQINLVEDIKRKVIIEKKQSMPKKYKKISLYKKHKKLSKQIIRQANIRKKNKKKLCKHLL